MYHLNFPFDTSVGGGIKYFPSMTKLLTLVWRFLSGTGSGVFRDLVRCSTLFSISTDLIIHLAALSSFKIYRWCGIIFHIMATLVTLTRVGLPVQIYLHCTGPSEFVREWVSDLQTPHSPQSPQLEMKKYKSWKLTVVNTDQFKSAVRRNPDHHRHQNLKHRDHEDDEKGDPAAERGGSL